MIILSREQIIALHSQLISETGGIDGIRDEGLLSSALNAPFQSFGDVEVYPSIQQKATRLGFGLVKNHAFIDGNKRIGAMMVQLLLQWNGYHLELKPGELADMFIAIANDSANEATLLHWIETHLRS